MTDREPLGLVERVSMIAATVDAVCGHTDDPDKAAMRAITFCLALNFHIAMEVDQTERARNFIKQVRDISGCDGVELTIAVALFSIRAQDMLEEEVQRVQQARQAEVKETEHLGSCVDVLEAEIKDLRKQAAIGRGITQALNNLLVNLADSRPIGTEVIADTIRGILESPTAALDD
jgi:hypothetical protein